MSKQVPIRTDPSREKKRAEFSSPAPRKKRLTPVLLIAIVALVALGAYLVFGGSGDHPQSATVVSTGQNAASQSAAGPGAGDIRIPLADLAGGQAKFFDYTLSNKTPVRFFALKSADGTYRAAMDACEVCFHAKKGYHQEGDDMVCNNCGKHFPTALVGEVNGGCHPIGLQRAVEGDQLVIKAGELESHREYFQ